MYKKLKEKKKYLVELLAVGINLRQESEVSRGQGFCPMSMKFIKHLLVKGVF